MMKTPAVESSSARPTDITLDDFMTGLIAGLAALNVHVVSIRGNLFYRAVIDAFHDFEEGAGSAGVRPRFRLRLNRVYGDSPDVRDAISRAVQRDLVSLDNPEYQDMRLKVSKSEADNYLNELAGGRNLYIEAASHFKGAYPTYA